jgi:hypothetical protein
MKKDRFFNPVKNATYASAFLLCMCSPVALFAQPEDLDEITIRVIEDHNEILGAHSLALPGMDEIEDKHLEHRSKPGRDETGSNNEHEHDHEYETGREDHQSHEIEEPEHEEVDEPEEPESVEVEEPEHEEIEEPESVEVEEPESVEIEEPEQQEIEEPEAPETQEVEEPEPQEIEDSPEYEEPQEPESTL